MKEVLLNGFIKIRPLEYNGFVASENKTYEMVGTVIASSADDIPVNSRVWFDSFMAKKYPVPGKENEYEWFVHHDEIVKYEINEG
jgi:hypothetical protein